LLKTVVLLNIFVEFDSLLFFGGHLRTVRSKEQVFFNIAVISVGRKCHSADSKEDKEMIEDLLAAVLLFINKVKIIQSRKHKE